MKANEVYKQIIERLQAADAPFAIHEHEAARTVTDAEEKLPFPKERFLKTVVFKIKNAGWILAAVRGIDSVDYRRLAVALEVKRGDIVRPSPEEVENVLGYEIGGVCPIPVRDDMAVVFDSETLTLGKVYCGSGRSDRTLEIDVHELVRVTQGRVFPLAREASTSLRIRRAFERAKREGRGALIPYFMCGYPSAGRSVELAVAAAEAGADVIELGMPFSDPLADGITIQHAGHVALERGMTIAGCLEIARQVSSRSETPLILMGYYNPVLAYGIERFCQAAAASGVCALIIPDLPPEEAWPLHQAAHASGLSFIFLVPPTAPGERIAHIARLAAADAGTFIYCVALSGVTGARATLPPHLRDFIARVRGYTKEYGIPLAVGFGLSTPEHIAEVTSYADGAVVASALINLIDQCEESEQVEAVRGYIRSLRPAK